MVRSPSWGTDSCSAVHEYLHWSLILAKLIQSTPYYPIYFGAGLEAVAKRKIHVMRNFRTISHVNVELKTNWPWWWIPKLVSETLFFLTHIDMADRPREFYNIHETWKFQILHRKINYFCREPNPGRPAIGHFTDWAVPALIKQW
jgi:hypothetical protein